MVAEDAPLQERELTVRQDIIDLFAKRIVKKIHQKVEKPLEEVKNHFPSSPEQVRALPFYESTLGALRYQRDSYLVGAGYAKRRQRLRDRGILNYPFYRMPFDSTALGNIQIIDVGASFIPSATIKDALLPIVVSLPSGALKETITDAVADAIPLAQPLLDSAIKYSLLTFMSNPDMRRMIKSRAGGIMVSRDDNNNNNNKSSSSTEAQDRGDPKNHHSNQHSEKHS